MKYSTRLILLKEGQYEADTAEYNEVVQVIWILPCCIAKVVIM